MVRYFKVINNNFNPHKYNSDACKLNVVTTDICKGIKNGEVGYVLNQASDKSYRVTFPRLYPKNKPQKFIVYKEEIKFITKDEYDERLMILNI